MSQNERLRHDRLTFYKEDVDRIDKLLAEFLRLSGAKCALLIDKEGHLVTKRGEVRTIDMDTISALVAGSFALPADDETAPAEERPPGRALAQPFLPSAQTEGEYSFVFFDRELSHALRKVPAPGDYRIQSMFGSSSFFLFAFGR